MKEVRKRAQEAIITFSIAELQRIHEHQKTARLENAGELACNCPPHIGRNFMEEELRRYDVETLVGIRQLLGICARDCNLVRANVI